MSVTTVDGPDELRTVLDDARSLLFLASSNHVADEVCSALLSVAAVEQTQFLSVTFDDTPDERLDIWRANIGPLPPETGVIAVGEPTRSVAASGSHGPGTAAVTVNTVTDPADLTGLAIAIGAYLDAWGARSETPVVCFHSITSLLYHADEERAFRFIHSMSGRLYDIGAVAHYHLNPEAHDISTVNRFSSLVDAIVRIEDDGSVSVRKRQ